MANQTETTLLRVSRRGKFRLEHEALFVVLLVVSIGMAFPLLIVVSTALKPDSEMVMSEFSLVPRAIQLRNFISAFEYGPWARYYFNSVFVTVVTVLGSLALNSLAGFSFARLRFPGRERIPLAGGNNIFGQGGRGWLDSYWALIVPFLSGSFGIFLCRQFFLSIPKSLDEAARIDGARPFTMYTRIFLPLAKPVLATLAILKTAHTWNNFFYPLVMISSPEMYTVQLALQQFHAQYTVEWNLLMAATLVSIIPMILVFFAAQKHFVAGVATAGVKG